MTAIAMLSACHSKTVYNHYEHTSVAGWERNDTLSFDISAMEAGGSYLEELGLRINGEYPFMSVSLIVEQTTLPRHTMRCDTLVCSLIDERGNATGQGISHYQYVFPLRTLKLDAGESLHIAVRHDMKREMLPGITNVGIRLQKKQ